MSDPQTVVTRFAPSPTGYLHLGHAYSALVAARLAGDGKFILRIEDIDPGRCRPEFEEALYEDLAWLGLEWETPVRRQSDCMADYVDALNNIEVLRSRQAIAAARNDAGANLAQLGRHEAALTAYTESLKHWAAYASAQLNMAESLAALGRYAEAAARYRQVLGLDAGSVPAQGRLAWILATAPDENVRRPKEAVALASSAVSATAGEVPELLDTLAAAQAAAGNFREALAQIGAAVKLAEAQGRNDLLAVMRQRRNLYEQGRPYLESKH